MDASTLSGWVSDAWARAFDLIDGLDEAQLMGPPIPIVNPLRWEIGHVAWFLERWALRRSGGASILDGADALYDSSAVAHHTRWALPLPSTADTLGYCRAVRDALLERLAAGEPGEEAAWFTALGVFHADMHNEAFAITRQILEYPEPAWPTRAEAAPEAGPCPGDVEVPGLGGFREHAADPGAEPDHAVGICVDNLWKTCLRRDQEAHFLAHFPRDAGLDRLPRLDLPAGKLPIAPIHRVVGASGDQNLVVGGLEWA